MASRTVWAAGAACLLVVASSQAFASSNLVVNGNFSAGNTGFTTGYSLTTMTPQLFQNNVHGIYAVIPIGDVAGQSAYGDWVNVTTDPSGGNGNVFVADGATNPNTTVWGQTVSVTAHTNYTFSFYAAEISNACCSNANFVPTIDGTSGSGNSLIGSWQQYTFSWNSGSNTSAVLSLTDTNLSGGFNDFVLTDISLTAVGSGVPEPSTWELMALGFAGLGLMGYRTSRKSVAISA
jgi:hypothetical protein